MTRLRAIWNRVVAAVRKPKPKRPNTATYDISNVSIVIDGIDVTKGFGSALKLTNEPVSMSDMLDSWYLKDFLRRISKCDASIDTRLSRDYVPPGARYRNAIDEMFDKIEGGTGKARWE